MNLSSIISGTKPSQVPGIYWRRLNTKGDEPTSRVGHTASVANNRGIYFIGGANSSQSFPDIFLLNLEDFKWTKLSVKLNKQRYDHCSANINGKIVVFGGSNENGNLNDVEVLTDHEIQWKTLTSSNSPCSRTHHSTDIVKSDCIVVFGGGLEGCQPVDDLSVYNFNATENKWTKYESNGDIPLARQGHLIIAIENKVYIHGGMAGDVFYDDLYVFDVEDKRWSSIKRKDDSLWPCCRAGHGGASMGRCFIIFGGLTASGASNDSYLFNTETETWEKLQNEGEFPSPRLDFAFTKLSMATLFGITTNETDKEASTSALMVLNGGMDTNGSIYNDTFIACIKSQVSQ